MSERVLPLYSRAFHRGERCANCISYIPSSDSPMPLQHYLSMIAKELGWAPSVDYLLARLLCLVFGRLETQLGELEQARKTAPGMLNQDGSSPLEAEILRVRRKLHQLRPRLPSARERCDRAGDAGDGSVPIQPAHLLYLANLEPVATVCQKLGMQPEDLLVVNAPGAPRFADYGLCRRGAPSRLDSSGSDLTSGGYRCDWWENPHVAFQDGLGDAIPGDIEAAMDANAKRTPEGT